MVLALPSWYDYNYDYNYDHDYNHDYDYDYYSNDGDNNNPDYDDDNDDADLKAQLARIDPAKIAGPLETAFQDVVNMFKRIQN